MTIFVAPSGGGGTPPSGPPSTGRHSAGSGDDRGRRDVAAAAAEAETERVRDARADDLLGAEERAREVVAGADVRRRRRDEGHGLCPGCTARSRYRARRTEPWPQHCTCPPAPRAHVWISPAAARVTPEIPGDGAWAFPRRGTSARGTGGSSLLPQQESAPVESTAQAWLPPSERLANDADEATLTGTSESDARAAAERAADVRAPAGDVPAVGGERAGVAARRRRPASRPRPPRRGAESRPCSSWSCRRCRAAASR